MAGHFQEFEDEYLETMYEFYEQDKFSRVRTGDLAERLKVSPASATEMIQRLSSKGFIDYERYGYAPNRCALGLVRVVSVVGMPWPCDAVRLHSTVVLQRGGRRQSSSQGCREVLSAAGRMGQSSRLLPL